MYLSGLGFWSSLLKFGTGVVQTAAPAIVTAYVNSQTQRHDGNQIIPTSVTSQSAATLPQPRPRPARQRNKQIIPGVNNAVLLLGGAALIGVVVLNWKK